MSVLTPIQKKILRMIPLGMERPCPRVEIEQATGMSKRAVENAIERIKYQGWPIVAVKKDCFHGYYIPMTDAERKEGLQAYRNQIRTSQKMVQHIEGIELEGIADRLKEALA